MTARAAPRDVGAALRALKARPDREHEMAFNRLALSGLVVIYLAVAGRLGNSDAAAMLAETWPVFVAYDALALALFAHLLRYPDRAAGRRLGAIVLDVGLFAYGLHVGDEAMAPFYPILLWIVFGNGFRFGVPYLFAAGAAAVLAFGFVVLFTPFWQLHRGLGVGLLLALVFLPLYAAALIRRLDAARRQAEEASRAKSLFLAGVSHELRTPLNAVIGLSDLLAETRLDPEQDEMARTVGASGRSLLSLIDGLLDVSRLEAGRMPRQAVEFDLHARLALIRRMLGPGADAKGLRLGLHIAPDTPRRVKGGERHLEEILLNLVGNAVKFTEAGFVAVSASVAGRDEAMVRLRVEVADTGIGIAPDAQARIFDSFTQADETIVDRFGGTGLGLALSKQLAELHGGAIGVESRPGEGSTFWFELEVEALAEEAEEPFGLETVVVLSRDPSVAAAVGRLGLAPRRTADLAGAGAALSELRLRGSPPVALVDAGALGPDGAASAARTLLGEGGARPPALVLLGHAGAPSAELRSLFATGARKPLDPAALAAALRVAAAVAGGAEPAASEREAGSDGNRRRLSILVAEDNRTNQMVITKILERAGHRVEIRENGEAAFDALLADPFDIALLDINMPVMNGIEAAKLYRFAAGGGRTVPLVALTADATPDARARCEEAGMDACLTKPVEARRLLEIVEAIASRAGSAEPERPKTVDAIADHPKFRAARPTVDTATLSALEQLGGRSFVADLVQQFLGDADRVLRAVRAAAAENDAAAFRDQLHALRSSAANLGATGLYDLCLAWRDLGARELSERGADHVRTLGAEFERVRAALETHVAGAAPDGRREAAGGRP